MNIVYAREENLTAPEFIDVLERSTLAERRPVDDAARIEDMLKHANLTVTARLDGKLIGVARAVTDFSFCCYISDLAVDQSIQRQGVGQRLIKEVRALVHPKARVFLISAPGAISFYERIGLERITRAFDIP